MKKIVDKDCYTNSDLKKLKDKHKLIIDKK